MAVFQRAFVPLAAVVVLLCAGVAQATTCPSGFKDCDKHAWNGCEINVHTDAHNCGDCGHRCADLCGANTIPACKGAKCEFTCKAPFLNCDSNWKNGCEVDGSHDANNCGSCGHKCPVYPNANTKCNGGKCEFSCHPGFSNCDGKWENGCEVHSGTDANNCGSCGHKCPVYANAVTKCNGGKCEYSCKPGFSNCDGKWENGCEVHSGTDAYNCGSCGHKCPVYPNASTKCNGGKCEYSCHPGFSNCDGKWENGCEVLSGTDAYNCGSCGHKCPVYPNAITKCNGGKCEYSCKPGFSNCDGKWENGCEAYSGTDVNNCGSCGHKCAVYPNTITKCNGGKCEYSCKPGFNNCDGKLMNGCEAKCGSDVNNCGACGNKCKVLHGAWSACTGGKCLYYCKPGYANCDKTVASGCESFLATDPNNCGGCGKKCPTPRYAGGEAKCNHGRCETQSCKKGWKWEGKKNCCVTGGRGW